MAFQYLNGITGQKQLYFDDHLWYNTRARPNYWSCTEPGCGSHLTTNDDKLKDESKPLPKHSHDPISLEEFRIRRHFSVIKKRIETEVHTFPSEIFEDEIIKLQVDHGVSAEAIGEYVRPYAFYKSGFEKMRSKNKPKMPEDIEQLDFSKYPESTRTLHKKELLQYDNKAPNNRILIFASETG